MPDFASLADHIDDTPVASWQSPARTARFTLSEGPLSVDFSKQAMTDSALDALLSHAAHADLDGWRARLFAGEAINTSEGRAVLHMALRGVGGTPEIREAVADMRARMAAFAEEIVGRYDAVIHIGIGGSDLGPRLVAEAFRATMEPRLDLRFINNIDAASVNDALRGLDPSRTLAITVSKSFGTIETLMNARAVRDWGVARMLAVTTNRDKAVDFGVGPEDVFDFWDWVGGRYSVWSAVGLSLILAYGADAFDRFLGGARHMDTHFRDQPLAENLPVMMALTSIWNTNVLGYATRAVVPYAQRLRLLPAFLQQLEMESNGKGAGRDGDWLSVQTCPVVWGSEGTNGQHAFFQWLHQGRSHGRYGGAPVDFVLVETDHEGHPEHHRILLANGRAQADALMVGKTEDSVRAELGERDDADALAPQKTFPGNRPSTTLTLDALTPDALGHLIALYEHKTFVEGVLWGVNSFDQWGVELGKAMAVERLKADEN